MTPDADLGAKQRASAALRDDLLRDAVRFTVDRLSTATAQSTEALGDWQEWREQGRRIRAHTIANLDFYLEQFVESATRNGTQVCFAANAEEARAEVLRIVRAEAAERVVKSKSMLSEEIHLNDCLEQAGVEVVETDLGEWIVQLAHEKPAHIILPAIHKPRAAIRSLFEDHAGQTLASDTHTLAGYAHQHLRREFVRADIGITGCNFAVAETGSVVLFTNEGNGRMVTTLPKTHVVLMGMERIVPSFEDLEIMAMLLPRSATGQKLTTYMNIMSGPRAEPELDGPVRQFVIIIDNGRSAQLGDPDFQEILHCIRCGACLNVCPVYRQIGGHAYGSVYPGPIGAVLTPLLEHTPRTAELANLSTLCGACYDACPVKIPIHDMLVQLRRRNVERGLAPAGERLAMHGYAKIFGSARVQRAVFWLLSVAQRSLIGRAAGWLMRRFGPLRAMARQRALPVLPRRSFRAEWKKLKKGAPL